MRLNYSDIQNVNQSQISIFSKRTRHREIHSLESHLYEVVCQMKLIWATATRIVTMLGYNQLTIFGVKKIWCFLPEVLLRLYICQKPPKLMSI